MNEYSDTVDAALDSDEADQADDLGDGARKPGASWTDPEPTP